CARHQVVSATASTIIPFDVW
nr:immunoglobulin heavy chain junction region [Macaca mulatta]MOX94856.1 immunoglobulin heavy chain junction region [Macaca mulatta]MOX95414.1 immunoglobulin heavy chain junction region [Macaca mulatta]MOX96607.1 immunoglobulin heavy chain junction region [Macaca mulatta]